MAFYLLSISGDFEAVTLCLVQVTGLARKVRKAVAGALQAWFLLGSHSMLTQKRPQRLVTASL